MADKAAHYETDPKTGKKVYVGIAPERNPVKDVKSESRADAYRRQKKGSRELYPGEHENEAKKLEAQDQANNTFTTSPLTPSPTPTPKTTAPAIETAKPEAPKVNRNKPECPVREMTSVTPGPWPITTIYPAVPLPTIIQIAAAENILYALDSYGRIWRGDWRHPDQMAWTLLQTPVEK